MGEGGTQLGDILHSNPGFVCGFTSLP